MNKHGKRKNAHPIFHTTKIQLLTIPSSPDLLLLLFLWAKMKKEELYFLIIGSIIALLLSYLLARYNESQGYRFWSGFIYTAIIFTAGVLYLWLWLYGR
jgi:hypothetical protein